LAFFVTVFVVLGLGFAMGRDYRFYTTSGKQDPAHSPIDADRAAGIKANGNQKIEIRKW